MPQTLDSWLFPKKRKRKLAVRKTKRKIRKPKKRENSLLAKTRSLYKIQAYVTSGGKPRSSHPWFSVAGGLLGSTGARVKTKVKLSEKLSYSDLRDMESRLKKWGFEEKWHARMGRPWSGTFYQKVDYEHRSVKAQTKEEKQRLKALWLEHYRKQIDPYMKINIEYGDY